MATSGLTTVQVSSNLRLEFAWNRTSYSAENNTSTIYWEFALVSVGAFVNFSKKNVYYVQVNGNEYEGNVESLGIGFGGGTVTLATGTTVIPHNADGTRTFAYSFAQSVQSYGIKSGGGIGELDSIQRQATITSAPDFNDEENPTITYSNPAGNAADFLAAAIYLTDDVTAIAPYRDISKTGSSYTFELTDGERTALRNAITRGRSITVTFMVRTDIDGEVSWSRVDRKASLVNYEPALAPRVWATDEDRTKELTGDSSGGTIINNYSEVSFNTGAAARKGATIEYQTITCGSTILDDYTSNTGTIDIIDSNTFYFSVKDSRGYITRDAVVFSEDNGKFIPYYPPSCRIKSTTLDGNGNLKVSITGGYFNGSFGAKDNTFEIDYSIWDEDGNYITNPDESGWDRITDITPTMIDDIDYVYEFTVSGLHHAKQHTIEVYVVDEITNSSASSKVVAAVPAFDWSKTDFRHHTDIYLDEGKGVYALRTDGTKEQLIGRIGYVNTFGYGGYQKGDLSTAIYGNNLELNYKNAIRLNNTPLADFVVEQKSIGTWFYRKWDSGRVELFGYKNVTNLACNTLLGTNWYRTAVQSSPAFPFTVYNPHITATYESEGFGALVWPTTNSTTSRPFNLYLIRPTSSEAITGKITYCVAGTWK